MHKACHIIIGQPTRMLNPLSSYWNEIFNWEETQTAMKMPSNKNNKENVPREKYFVGTSRDLVRFV